LKEGNRIRPRCEFESENTDADKKTAKIKNAHLKTKQLKEFEKDTFSSNVNTI
jgi:hypothetical protein